MPLSGEPLGNIYHGGTETQRKPFGFLNQNILRDVSSQFDQLFPPEFLVPPSLRSSVVSTRLSV